MTNLLYEKRKLWWHSLIWIFDKFYDFLTHGWSPNWELNDACAPNLQTKFQFLWGKWSEFSLLVSSVSLLVDKTLGPNLCGDKSDRLSFTELAQLEPEQEPEEKTLSVLVASGGYQKPFGELIVTAKIKQRKVRRFEVSEWLWSVKIGLFQSANTVTFNCTNL